MANKITRERFNQFKEQFNSEESGQGITEYGAMMAFVALLIAMLFMVGHWPFS